MKQIRFFLIFICTQILFSLSFSSHSLAAEKMDVLRRWVVFPFDSEASLQPASENAWWKARERITNQKRFLVASKQFLVQKDVYQPRKELKPDDVKVLAQLLDAHVLITGYTSYRQFTLNVYLAQGGQLLWSKKMGFHPSLKAADQIEQISDKLVREFLSQVPYQAFTVLDPLIGKPVYEENGKKFAIIDIGSPEKLEVGDNVQWVEVLLPETPGSRGTLPDAKLNLIAEGKIAQIKNGIAVAEVLRATTIQALSEKTLVRFPQVVEKIAKQSENENPLPEILPTFIDPVSSDSGEGHRQATIFGSILSILGVLALAF